MDPSVDADDPVCLKYIGDGGLRRLLSKTTIRAVCASCGQRRRAVSVEEVAQAVDEVFGQYYEPGEDVPTFHEDSDNPHYQQEGEQLQWIVQEIAGVEPDVAEAIAKAGTHDDTSLYVARDLPPIELELEWAEFCRRTKHERRFFDEGARQTLATILGDEKSIRGPDNPLSKCLVELKKGARLFRARPSDTRATAERIVAERTLDPPPSHLAASGRMNPSGIAVFYGGFSEAVCVAEVRPDVGGFVVIGQFQTLRRLRLLDLTAFGQRWFPGSMFRSDYYERVTKRQFLVNFHRLVSRAVQPHEAAIEHVPTQVVAEYSSNWSWTRRSHLRISPAWRSRRGRR